MSSFWDPQSGTTYRLIDLKLVHFWSKTVNLRSLRQKTHKQTHDPTAIAAPESSPKLLQRTDKQTTDNYFRNAGQRKWRFAQLPTKYLNATTHNPIDIVHVLP